MSSQPSNPPPSRKRVPFEQWRKVMLAGAFVLLGNALAAAMLDTPPPAWLTMILNFVGYGLLAVGFGIRMRSIKEARRRAADDKKSEAVEQES